MLRSFIAMAAIATLASCTTYENWEARDVGWRGEGVGDSKRFVSCYVTRHKGHGQALGEPDLQIVDRGNRTQIIQTQIVGFGAMDPVIDYFLDVTPTGPSTYKLEWRGFEGVGAEYSLSVRKERMILPCLNSTQVAYEAQRPAD